MQLTETERATLDARGFIVKAGRIIRHTDLPDLEAQRRARAEARQRHLAGLDAQRAEERRREEERIDTVLAPRKDLERHRWLAEHPDKVANDFERVWREHLRPVAVAELEAGRQQATAAALVASGRYSF